MISSARSIASSVSLASKFSSHSKNSSNVSPDQDQQSIYESSRSVSIAAKMLYELCDQVIEDDTVGWDTIRAWLVGQTEEDARIAAEHSGELSATPLHLVCRSNPPLDIVKSLVQLAPHVTEWVDSFGWLPLHYSCNNGASEAVIQFLVEIYPPSMIAPDKKGRTPLHFALNFNKPATPLSIELLASSGAAKLADENLMLPLHYASAYGASQEVMRNLILAYPNSPACRDRKGRIGLHYVMSNGDRCSSPGVVNILVTFSPETTNFTDYDGNLPIHFLRARAHTKDIKHENIINCLRYYLSAKPIMCCSFLTTLQSLPEWLRDVAVLTPSVQDNLNMKIAKRLPTSILMFDFYFLILIIVFFTLGVNESIDIRFSQNSEQENVSGYIIIMLYGCGAYFVAREVVQMMGLWSLGLFRSWINDVGNWMDILSFTLVFIWATLMRTGGGDHQTFRIGTTLSLGVFWASMLNYIKSVNIEFAVFVAGVTHVVKQLAAFLIAAAIFLFAFAFIFQTIFIEEDEFCPEADSDEFFFCSLWDSFVQNLTFMLGELEDDAFVHSVTGIIFFILFICLISIILSTVLIAIVTDSYAIIKGKRSAIVFWNNRLDFVSEMDAIMNGPWKERVIALFCPSINLEENSNEVKDADDEETFLREFWEKLSSIYDNEELQVMSFDFWAYTLLRFVTAIFVIFILFPLGLISAGSLWPPQLRKYFFVTSMVKSNSADESAINADDSALQELTREVQQLRDVIGMKLMNNRNKVTTLKYHLKEMRAEMSAELKIIKQITVNLYEMHRQSVYGSQNQLT